MFVLDSPFSSDASRDRLTTLMVSCFSFTRVVDKSFGVMQ